MNKPKGVHYLSDISMMKMGTPEIGCFFHKHCEILFSNNLSRLAFITASLAITFIRIEKY